MYFSRMLDKKWLQKVSEYDVRCLLCNIQFTIKYEGVKGIKKHSETTNHLKNEKTINMNNALKKYMNNPKSNEDDKVYLAEICLTYHGIMHHHSYLSTECGIDLSKLLFEDSKISKKIHCARTKITAIAENVLAPHSIERHIKALKNKKFSISTDASNKGNVKLFPIALQYFDKEKGIINFVLDFYEDSDESSQAIFINLKRILEINKLNVNDLVAYGADNAHVNYGMNKSVFKKLKDENKFIAKSNCNCHLIHNTAKYGLLKLYLDVESLVIKIYSHFSVSAKRVEAENHVMIILKMNIKNC